MKASVDFVIQPNIDKTTYTFYYTKLQSVPFSIKLLLLTQDIKLSNKVRGKSKQ